MHTHGFWELLWMDHANKIFSSRPSDPPNQSLQTSGWKWVARDYYLTIIFDTLRGLGV